MAVLEGPSKVRKSPRLPTQKSLNRQNLALLARLREADDMIAALRSGAADALIDSDANVVTLKGADHPYRLMVEMMGEGSVTVSSDGTILYCNDRFAQMVERTHQELVGSPFGDLLPPDERTRAECMVKSPPAQPRREKVRLRRRDGEITTQITTRSLALSGVEGIIATVTDLTELENARRARDLFFASMSHELRTPLTSILGYVGVILGRVAGPLNEAQERQLSIVKRSGEHLLGLVNNLLDLAKIEAGEVTVKFEPLSCRAIADGVAAMLRPLAAAKALRLRVVAPNRDVRVRSDALALSQILINLIGNSIKFTDMGEIKIEIHRRRNGGRRVVEFCIIDSGRGITLDEQESLFESFKRVDAPHEIPTEGTGLGLYISKKFAKLIGAHISFKSTFGKGSSFALCIDGDTVADLEQRAAANAKDQASLLNSAPQDA